MKQFSRIIMMSIGFGGLVGELYADSQGSKVEWDADFTVGILNEAEKIIDTRKSDVATVCGIMKDADGKSYCGPTKAKDHTSIDHGFWADSTVGVKFKKNDAISGYASFKMNLKESEVKAKKYYLTIDTGAGDLVMGNATLPFSEMIWDPDVIEYAAGPVAGASYKSRQPQVMYNTAKMLGDLTVYFGFVQAQNYGPKTDLKAESPGLELAVKYDNGAIKGGLGIHTEKYNYQDTDSVKTENPTVFAVNAGYDAGMVDAGIAFGAGDPIFMSGATHKAVIAKGLKDKINSLMLKVSAKFDPMKAMIFYGSEVANLSKDNGHMDKTGVVKDVKEEADTIGLRFEFGWNGATWFAEVSSTKQKYDGVVYRDKQWAGAGISASFGS